jgi:hypothetical protein
LAGFEQAKKVEDFRQPEVQYFHFAVECQLDVRWFQIAMDNPVLVRSFQCLGDLLRNLQRFVNRDSP